MLKIRLKSLRKAILGSIISISLFPMYTYNSYGQDKTLSTDNKETQAEQDTSFLSNREKIIYAVFNSYLQKQMIKLAHAEKLPPNSPKYAYTTLTQVIFLEDYNHKLSDRFLSLFKNTYLPIVSSDRIDPKKPYGDQKGFQRYTDKTTELKGFKIIILQLKGDSSTKTTVLYAVKYNKHSGGSFRVELLKKSSKWEVVKEKGGYKY